MSSENMMVLISVTAIVAGILVPALLVFLAVRLLNGPAWAAWVGALAGAAVGAFVVFTYVFPDFLPSAAREAKPKMTLEILVPNGRQSFVYLFFDSQLPPLVPSGDHRYTLTVPASGRLRVGQYPGQEQDADLTVFAFRDSNGRKAQVADGSLASGSQSKNGRSVIYLRPFLGSTTAFEAERKKRMAAGTFFDELEVFEKMRSEASEGTSAAP